MVKLTHAGSGAWTPEDPIAAGPPPSKAAVLVQPLLMIRRYPALHASRPSPALLSIVLFGLCILRCPFVISPCLVFQVNTFTSVPFFLKYRHQAQNHIQFDLKWQFVF